MKWFFSNFLEGILVRFWVIFGLFVILVVSDIVVLEFQVILGVVIAGLLVIRIFVY